MDDRQDSSGVGDIGGVRGDARDSLDHTGTDKPVEEVGEYSQPLTSTSGAPSGAGETPAGDESLEAGSVEVLPQMGMGSQTGRLDDTEQLGGTAAGTGTFSRLQGTQEGMVDEQPGSNGEVGDERPEERRP